MSEAIHCFDRATVRFAIYPDGIEGPRILAEITDDALRDLFGARGGPDELLSTLDANFPRIEAAAVDAYRRRPTMPIVLDPVQFQWAGMRAPPFPLPQSA